jgi:hypothetical protein
MEFLQAISESDDPFRRAHFDGVMGLALPALRTNASSKANLLEVLVATGAIPAARFSVFMSKEMHGDSEIIFGDPNLAYADGPLIWTQLSEPGYWQFSLQSIAIGGKELPLCHMRQSIKGSNVSSFFGRMCCRTVSEFEHEKRCQYHANSTQRSHYTDKGVIIETYEDGRVAVKMHDGCVQKVPRKWLSLPDGCRGDGTIQAILDTGSSLMMAPSPIATAILDTLGVSENCTGRVSSFENLSFKLAGDASHELVMTSSDYMDVLKLPDGDYCWAHLIAMPETAKGAAIVLGMPFLRTFYTAFDAELQRVGFAASKQQTQIDQKKEYAAKTKKEEKQEYVTKRSQRVSLHGFRPGDT